MFQELRNEVTLVRILLILGIIAVGSYVFGIVWQILGNYADIFIILICAWLLSFMMEPLVDRIAPITKLSKVWATLLTYVLISALFTIIILLFVPTVVYQIQSMTQIIPKYMANTPPFLAHTIDTLTAVLNNSISYIPSVAQFLFSVFIVLIISFYFIIDKEKINKELFVWTPKKWHDELTFVQKVITDVFASFLRVQLIFGILAGVATWFVLRVLGVDFAASTGLLSGILALIPLIGPFLSLIPPILVAFINDPTKALVAGVLILIIQQVIFNVIGPKLLGSAFKVHPAVVLLSFLIGYKIAGSAGLVFAVPVLGIIAVITRDLSHHFLKHKD